MQSQRPPQRRENAQTGLSFPWVGPVQIIDRAHSWGYSFVDAYTDTCMPAAATEWSPSLFAGTMLLHETGHVFGLDEEDLAEMGLD
jgi:hypothetical protein